MSTNATSPVAVKPIGDQLAALYSRRQKLDLAIHLLQEYLNERDGSRSDSPRAA